MRSQLISCAMPSLRKGLCLHSVFSYENSVFPAQPQYSYFLFVLGRNIIVNVNNIRFDLQIIYIYKVRQVKELKTPNVFDTRTSSG